MCRRFDGDLKRPTLGSRSLSVSLQVTTALRFYTKGSFQVVSADVHRIIRPIVLINDVTHCLVRLSCEHVKMSTQQELVNVMGKFHQIAGFPNVMGPIDGTHIRIKSPPNDEHLFVNRKYYHSINVQGVCDDKLRFINIVVKVARQHT